MLKSKYLVTLAALMFLFTGMTSVDAQTLQEGLSMGPSTRPFGSTDDFIIDDELFEYDAQLWAPWDVTSMDGSSPVHSGFYAEFGFTYQVLSTPDAVPGQDPRNFEVSSNYSWGRDIELGYMGRNGSGWGLNWLEAEGTDFLRDGQFRFTAAGGAFNSPTVIRTNYDRVTLKRQFRQSLSNGGRIEPYIGVEYLSLRDFTHEDATAVTRFSQRVTNSAVGGKVGSRYFRDYGRFTVGGNVGISALYNSRRYAGTTIVGVPPGGAATTFTNRDDGFIPLFDLGAELRYHLTRDISIRGGVDFTYAWQGISRADTRQATLNPYSTISAAVVPRAITDEDLTATGVSFGLDWKR